MEKLELPATLDFTEIADTSSFPYVSSPSINDQGTVAFRTDTDSSASFFVSQKTNNNSSVSIFTSNGTQLTNIYTYNPRFSIGPVPGTNIYNFDTGNTPVINNTGTVAFDIATGSYGGGKFRFEDIVEVNNGEISLIPLQSNNDGSSFLYTLTNLAINDSGMVVFRTEYTGGDAIEAINNGQLSTLIYNGGYSGSPVLLSGPSINNKGTVAFSGPYIEYLLNSNSSLIGLSLLGKGILTTSSSYSLPSNTSYTTGTPVILEDNTFGGFSSPAINDQGTIAFAASQSPEGAGIFEISNGQLTNIANTNGAFNSFNISSSYPDYQGGIVSLNQQGTVAFEAQLKSGGTGIFTGPDPVADKVIATGDSLLGATVTSLSFASTGLNNEQQVAFFATLSNGTSGIFRADIQNTKSTPVPESNNVLEILGFGVIVMGVWERKKVIKPSVQKRQEA